ncbi:MAG TPA: ABC transporter ATP-binding protein [Bacilli bacterium]|nr:ABC transporter ATP-binding protein [Bacilli bacterium]
MSNVIEIRNLTKMYGKSRGILHVNLDVKEGEIFGFIGPNGAGKSTTIKLLLNFIYPTSGSATIFDLSTNYKSKEIKSMIGYVPSEVNFYRGLTVKQVILYACKFYRNIDYSYVYDMCEKFELDMDKKVEELSLGNKKKVAVVQALVHKPRLLLLDEPTNGLDPLMQKVLFNHLEAINKKGVTIFLSSHNLEDVQRYCSRVAIIKEGRIIDVKKIDQMTLNKSKLIRIRGKDITIPVIQSIGGIFVEMDRNLIVFEYHGDFNKLLRSLYMYQIEDIYIENKKLADAFIDYYK